jgi:hypothetical protein
MKRACCKHTTLDWRHGTFISRPYIAATVSYLGASYTFRNLAEGFNALKLQLNIFDLFDQHKVTSISPGKTFAGDQYTYQAPRSYQV